MDIFDAISIIGETYCNTKNDMKYNDDPLEVSLSNFLKSKKKIDKMYDDEMKSYNKRRDLLLDLFD